MDVILKKTLGERFAQAITTFFGREFDQPGMAVPDLKQELVFRGIVTGIACASIPMPYKLSRPRLVQIIEAILGSIQGPECKLNERVRASLARAARSFQGELEREDQG